MKKLFLPFLALVMVLFFAACNDKNEEHTAANMEYVKLCGNTSEAADLDIPVSNESFALLQETFAHLAELYDQVSDLYSADEIAANETISSNLSKAKEAMTTMACISIDHLTEQDASELKDAMELLTQALTLAVEDMQAA